MSSAAEAAWIKAKGAPARSAFIQGYEAGAFDERIRVAEFISVNMAMLTDFAGDRVDELIAFMFREMTPGAPADEPVSELADCPCATGYGMACAGCTAAGNVEIERHER